MVIPKEVKLLGVTYAVSEVQQIAPGSSDGGRIDHFEGTIQVVASLPAEIKQRTLLHEVTHGILAALGQWELHGDEQFVSAFASAWYQVLRDNELLLG